MVGTVANQPSAVGCGHFDHATVRTQPRPNVNAIWPFLSRNSSLSIEVAANLSSLVSLL